MGQFMRDHFVITISVDRIKVLNIMTHILVNLSTALLTQQESAVGTVTGYGLMDGPGVGVRVPVGARFIFSPVGRAVAQAVRR
jgi:hypothetical protein